MGLAYLKNVSTLSLRPEKCIGCATCTHVCPHQVLVMENKKARIDNKEACMECGACRTNCPASAIDVRSGVG